MPLADRGQDARLAVIVLVVAVALGLDVPVDCISDRLVGTAGLVPRNRLFLRGAVSSISSP